MRADACDTMRREGLTTMGYMEQLSWLLFLKSFVVAKAGAESRYEQNQNN